MQVLVAPDAAHARMVRCLTLARVSRAHRTLAPDADRTLFARPVVRDVSKCARGVSDWWASDVGLSVRCAWSCASGDPVCLWCSLCTGSVCTGRVWCEAAERLVWLVQTHAC